MGTMLLTKQQRQALEDLRRAHKRVAANRAASWRQIANQATQLRQDTETLVTRR
jgi:hypothetical protein